MDQPASSVSPGIAQVPATAEARPEPGDGQAPIPDERRYRVVIENVSPEIDCGEFPIKRTTGEVVVVEADIFAEAHDALTCLLLYRKVGEPAWHELPMTALGNDRWRAAFTVGELGRYSYTLMGWVDRFGTWARDLRVRREAGQHLDVDLMIGAGMVAEASRLAARRERGGRPGGAEDERRLQDFSEALRDGSAGAVEAALSDELAGLMQVYADRRLSSTYGKELAVMVERPRARFGAWYELFPRSTASEPGRHGTLRDLEARLPYIASMGFDVVYLPPIHPIGQGYRKGPNNQEGGGPDDPGSPWAIGSPEGGHTSIHPQLGTLDDFRRLVVCAGELGLEIALDVAFQTSPDHPYVRQHPEWYRWRPDNTIQYAENPPKKYQDIYPLDFETEHWRTLWQELLGVVTFWIGQGVRIFRIDNPHTKPFAFWHWLIGEVKRDYPDVIFLSEAFTRPKVMKRLAKLGFSQSYTYFTWRNTCEELTEYFTELTKTEMREYLRPNLWTNTQDILHEYLQVGGPPAFTVRLVLAATLGASYGIYGPAFELTENVPLQPGSEEYLNSEKYEVRHWDLERAGSLHDLIARVNSIRRENVALQSDWSLQFHPVDDEELICYSKQTDDRSNIVLVVVNLDPHHARSGTVELPLDRLQIDPRRPYQVHDLLSDRRFLWDGPRNLVTLDPGETPARIFRIRRHLRTEHDFDYYL